MSAEKEAFGYILIPDEGGFIPHQRFMKLLESISQHSIKHDFANMLIKKRICIRLFSIEEEDVIGIYLPFQHNTFNDLTALNWYVKTQSAKQGFQIYQMILPNGEILQ